MSWSPKYPRALRPTRAYHYTLERVRVLSIKTILLWYMTPLSLVYRYGHRELKLEFPPKLRHISTKFHCVIFFISTAHEYPISQNKRVKFPCGQQEKKKCRYNAVLRGVCVLRSRFTNFVAFENTLAHPNFHVKAREPRNLI